MGLLDDIREDIRDITTSEESGGVELTLEAPTGEIAVIFGYHTKHHLGVDPQTGKQVNTKNAHCSFSESVLTELAYPVRVNNEVNLKGHKVSAKDSTGNVYSYIVHEWFPDETVGLIVCILGDFA